MILVKRYSHDWLKNTDLSDKEEGKPVTSHPYCATPSSNFPRHSSSDLSKSAHLCTSARSLKGKHEALV